MGLYRRLNDIAANRDLEAFAAEMIDRFGLLSAATDNLRRMIEIKMGAKIACVARQLNCSRCRATLSSTLLEALVITKAKRGFAAKPGSVGVLSGSETASREPVDAAPLFDRTMKRFPKTMARLAE